MTSNRYSVFWRGDARRWLGTQSAFMNMLWNTGHCYLYVRDSKLAANSSSHSVLIPLYVEALQFKIAKEEQMNLAYLFHISKVSADIFILNPAWKAVVENVKHLLFVQSVSLAIYLYLIFASLKHFYTLYLYILKKYFPASFYLQLTYTLIKHFIRNSVIMLNRASLCSQNSEKIFNAWISQDVGSISLKSWSMIASQLTTVVFSSTLSCWESPHGASQRSSSRFRSGDWEELWTHGHVHERRLRWCLLCGIGHCHTGGRY